MKFASKACATAPRVIASTVVVLLIVGPALPGWLGSSLFVAGLFVGAILIFGFAESSAIRLLSRARRPRKDELLVLAPVLAELCSLGLGPPVIAFYVSQRNDQPAAVTLGRRSIVIAPELIELVMSGQLKQREAVAILAHAGLIVRAGLTRNDLAIMFWTIPWRMLTALTRPLHGLLNLCWKIRPMVFIVAIVRTFSAGQSAGTVHGAGLAVALAMILLLSYAIPGWSARWAESVTDVGDRGLVRCGLGPDMAAYLRRFPHDPSAISRAQVFDPPSGGRPRLHLVCR